ncbi:MAG: HDOD domain-containing protein [candidate division Zixibacteria bacterium]|nr:HDOD domain-containing protein [candidate division Zixibacteria bacterium]
MKAPSESFILKKADNLPSPPFILSELSSMINRSDAHSHQIARVIEKDQSFSARILRLVNSSFYGFARKIVSIDEAITMLGINTIYQLLITTSVFQAFKSKQCSARIKKFWHHSFSVGVIARNLYPGASADTKSELLLSGVLHDIGRIALLKMYPEKFCEFYFESDECIDLNSETDTFGINHQVIGELLAEKWNFPLSLRMAISHHHLPLSAKSHKKYAAAIHVADIFSHGLQLGGGSHIQLPSFFPQTWSLLKINPDKLKEVLVRSIQEFEKEKVLIDSLNA